MVGQSDNPSIEVLHARQEKLKEAILNAAGSIRELVKKDLPRFAERETRWRWLEHIEFAESMSDESLSAFRRAIAQEAISIADDIGRELEEASVWLAPDEVPSAPRDRKLLVSNVALRPVFGAVGTRLAGVFAHFDLPADPEGTDTHPYIVEYRTPTYFLDGVYGPSLIEAYWAQMTEYVEINAAIAASQADARRQELAKRWSALST